MLDELAQWGMRSEDESHGQERPSADDGQGRRKGEDRSMDELVRVRDRDRGLGPRDVEVEDVDLERDSEQERDPQHPRRAHPRRTDGSP